MPKMSVMQQITGSGSCCSALPLCNLSPDPFVSSSLHALRHPDVKEISTFACKMNESEMLDVSASSVSLSVFSSV